MKSALDWLMKKSSAVVGKTEESLVTPSQINSAANFEGSNGENQPEPKLYFNGHRDEENRTPKKEILRENTSPWGHSLTPKSPKILSERITQSLAQTNISNVTNNTNTSRSFMNNNWDDIR